MIRIRVISKRPRVRRTILPWEKAYIAGVVDAKAAVTICPDIRGHLTTIVTLRHRNVNLLRMIQERYGGTIRFEDKSEENVISTYRLEINKQKDIVCLIKDISKYLIAKKKQADLLLKYCQSRLQALQSVEYSFLAPFTMEERSIARELIRLNHNLAEAKTFG